MKSEAKVIEVFKIDDTEFKALEVIAAIDCEHVPCNECPFAIAGQRCIREQAATIISNNTEVK